MFPHAPTMLGPRAAVLLFPPMKKPVHRAIYLEDALNILQMTECMYAELEHSDLFQALSTTQKTEYRDVLSLLRRLIHDLEQDNAQEQLAS